MKKFKNLEELSDDDLIMIVYEEEEYWQKEAVDYAIFLLEKRGIKDDFGKKRIIEIRKEIEALREIELEERKKESYGVLEMVFMSFFWFNFVLSDWYLNRNGYAIKRKQRLIAIGSGILFYLLIMLNAYFSFDVETQERIDEIIELERMDSISKSKIDWSGLYVFVDTSKNVEDKIIWELNVEKYKSDHSVKLRLMHNSTSLTISCVGLIKKGEFEFYPDTTYVLFNGQEISYYNRLFTLIKDDETIKTNWGKMRPFNQQKNDNIGFVSLSRNTLE